MTRCRIQHRCISSGEKQSGSPSLALSLSLVSRASASCLRPLSRLPIISDPALIKPSKPSRPTPDDEAPTTGAIPESKLQPFVHVRTLLLVVTRYWLDSLRMPHPFASCVMTAADTSAHLARSSSVARSSFTLRRTDSTSAC
jgi:hypothetical protein